MGTDVENNLELLEERIEELEAGLKQTNALVLSLCKKVSHEGNTSEDDSKKVSSTRTGKRNKGRWKV